MLSVSIVIPTRNEEDTIVELLMQAKCFGEVIVVDDSEDETPLLAERMDATVVYGQRKGLGQAIIDGINKASGDIIVVMDADLSHNPQDIPRLLKPIREQGADLVIASRYIKGGDVSNWDFKRRVQSLIGVKLMRLVTGVSDSNAGFFAFRKSILDGVTLKPHSWKIMLEVLFKGNWIFKAEVPIKFGDRSSGVSKNSLGERFKHALHILKLLVYKFPKRYISFSIIGGVGALSYFYIFWAITTYLHIWYGYSYFIATMIAILQNYTMNHLITFRKDKKHNRNHIQGLSKYIGGSWLGELVEYGIMLLLTEVFGIWFILSDFIGSGFSSVIKYTIFRKKVWGDKVGRTAASADYEWNAYFKGLPWQRRWKRIIAKIVKEFAEVDGNAGKVLDFGCGSSPQGLLINHDDYTGYDTNNKKIRYMNSKQLQGNCHFITGSSDTIQDCVLPNSVDTVLFIEVIEHLTLAKVDKALDVFHGKLKPHGRLIIATPNFGGIMGKLMDRLYGIFQKNAYQKEHQLKFDLSSLTNFCTNAGFRLRDYRIPSGADIVCLFEKV